MKFIYYTSEGDPYRQQVVLHIPGTGIDGNVSIPDVSPTPKPLTVVGNTRISTAQSKWGGGSVLCDGNGDYLTVSSSALAIGSSDFTIEGWFFPRSIQSGLRALFSHRATLGGFGGALLVSSAGSLSYYIANATGNGWQVTGIASGLTLTQGEWQFIKMIKSGNTITAYKNSLTGTSITLSSLAIGTSGSFAILAGSANGGQEFDAHFNDFRVTIGVARTSDLPTSPLPQS